MPRITITPWLLLFTHYVQLFVTPCTTAHQASLSFTISQSSIKFMSLESVMPSKHLIFCHPLILLPSIFPSIRVFSKESAVLNSHQVAKVLELQLGGGEGQIVSSLHCFRALSSQKSPRDQRASFTPGKTGGESVFRCGQVGLQILLPPGNQLPT